MPPIFRSPLTRLSLLAALVIAVPAFAAPPPPPPPGHPPRPAGPSVILDHNAGGLVHVDVNCTPAETTQACIDLAAQLYAKLNGEKPGDPAAK